MRHGALFNGIGGFQLAAYWMGWENVFHCEIDKFCNRVINQHFPQSICYEDIKKTDFTPWRGKIDIVSGGFPCQPYSTAGKRKGKEDARHLWPEKLRAIREIQPGWVLGENVRGLISWNGGIVFNEVQADLEASGYEVLPFLLPASGINAPHERYRIWFVAHAASKRCRKEGNGFIRSTKWPSGVGDEWASTHPHGQRQDEQSGNTFSVEEGQPWRMDGQDLNWANWPTQSPICRRDDGIPNRMDRIKALGNAIVPQVALQIFKAIESFESTP